MNTLFGGGLNDRERAERLESKYNIPDADYIYGQIRGISMSIEEELHASWGKHAIEDGIEAGELYTKGQLEELRISEIYQIVLKMTQNGIPIDEAIETYVPDDIRAEVRQRFSEE